MQNEAKKRLVASALAARKRAVAPYSRFQVGAALLTADNEIVTGANVESASYSLTCCAERVALFKALTEGKRDFTAIAVVVPARIDAAMAIADGVGSTLTREIPAPIRPTAGAPSRATAAPVAQGA